MSKHITTLPVDVSRVVKALPKGSYLHSIEFNKDKTGIEVIWEHDDIKTGRTYPVDYSVKKLADELPKVADVKGRLVMPELWPSFKKTLDS